MSPLTFLGVSAPDRGLSDDVTDQLKHRRSTPLYSWQRWSERPGDDLTRFGSFAAGRAVGGVGRSVSPVDADPHAVTPPGAGEFRKARVT